jgi:hypothetical protein
MMPARVTDWSIFPAAVPDGPQARAGTHDNVSMDRVA